MELIRTFISVDIPRRIQKEIKKLQDELPGFEGKRTELENLHLTLKFLGEINEERVEEIKKCLKTIKLEKFETIIDKIGCFDNRRSSKYSRNLIVWVHLRNCNTLQKIIDEKLEDLFKKEERFMSHVTIARVKFLKNKNYFLGELDKVKIPPGLKFNVNNFELKKSTLTPEGPVYESLEEYSLA